MFHDNNRELNPKLRFPQFRDEPAWTAEPLRESATVITEKAGERKCVYLSITSGVGLISQEEKFGRTIAGESYKNYLLIQRNDFAYNKSATKEFPQGFIAMYSGDEPASVPNSIFTCFRVHEDRINLSYLDYLFFGNLHGRWLRKYITVGARAHGSLSINDEDLMSLPIPRPGGKSSLDEQQKIADCLLSVDELIAAHSCKLDVLKAHKKGLVQQLFPREGENFPRLRFPEFDDAPQWEEKKLSALVDLVSGLHLSPNQYGREGQTPYFTGPSDFTNKIEDVTKRTNMLTNVAQENDILITVKGSGVGELWYLTLSSVAIGRQLMTVRATHSSSRFVYQYLLTKRARFEELASGNLIPGLSRGDILDMVGRFPPIPEEQRRIADCLFSLDSLIVAESEQVEVLKAHKKGLMQQLFPSPQVEP